MRIAFYAPLNAPDRGRPSGDRTIGRMILRALREAGHEVLIVSRFKSFDPGGDGPRQRRLEELGRRLAERLLPRLERTKPDLWLTYHLYHKAPDHLGCRLARALGIAYVAVEASVAGKQAHGPWQLGHRRVIDALGHADLVIGLNRADRDGVLPLLKSPERFRFFPPFIDCRPFAAARLAQHRGRPGGEPLLLAVGMLREGAKLASYRLLASALATLRDRPWRLLIAGDGEAEPQVRAAMAALGERVRFLGRKTEAELPALYASCDIFLWPAIKEAIGMVFIEAQAAGLPVVGAHNLGVPDVVDDGVTGFLPRYGDAGAFAEAVGTLLDDAELRQRMGLAAAGHALACHDIETAGRRFVKAIEDLAR